MTVSMSRFCQCPPDMTIAGFGDTATFDSAATGMFAGYKTEVGHELFCRFETGQIAKFGDGRCRNDQRDAAQSLRAYQAPDSTATPIPGFDW